MCFSADVASKKPPPPPTRTGKIAVSSVSPLPFLFLSLMSIFSHPKLHQLIHLNLLSKATNGLLNTIVAIQMFV